MPSALKELRIANAYKRQHERDSRSASEQIEYLDLRLGKDVGAVKERARLALILSASK